MRSLKDEADALYLENIAELGHAAELSSELNAAVQTAVRLTSATEGVNRPALRSQLRRDVDAAEHQVEELRLDPNIDEEEERELASQLATGWARFKGLTEAVTNDEQRNNARIEEFVTVGAANVDLVKELQAGQLTEAGEAYRRAGNGFARTTLLILLIVLAALAIGLGSVVWLTRNIVPRVSAYSSFAARVAAGERTTRLRPRGSDELSDLGAVLNEMVDRGENERAYQPTQAELVAALKPTGGVNLPAPAGRWRSDRSCATPVPWSRTTGGESPTPSYS